MCGIAGIIGAGGNRSQLEKIAQAMIARGPDGEGFWTSKAHDCLLAHRRLAIIDLSEGGAQPMEDQEAGLCLSFNGEIYNYRELKAKLEAFGHKFKSNSDTEVLLKLYRQYGREMFAHLRGMFAFILWDEKNKAVLLGRDHFGIKPLYYAFADGLLRAASQVKALLAGGGIKTTPSPGGEVGFFLWGHIPEPFTLYKEINSLPAGSYLYWQLGKEPEIKPYFQMREEIKAAKPAQVSLRDALQDSVAHHLIADVEVGLFLSAGLDSTTLAGLACQEHAGLTTFTLGFSEFKDKPYDETPLAELAAAYYRTNHQTSWVTKDDFAEARANILAAMDQPSIDGVNVYFVAQKTRELGLKVAISGLGGDEIFAGYNNFTQIPDIVNKLGKLSFLGKPMRLALAPFLKPKYASLLEYAGNIPAAYFLKRGLFMPWELGRLFSAEWLATGLSELQLIESLEAAIAGVDDSRLKIGVLETSFYMRNQLLRDADWAGMAHSLEIRTPLVDIGLFRKLLPALVGNNPPSKKDMAETPLMALPDKILNREKTGFFVPVSDWLQKGKGLRSWAETVFAEFKGC